MDSGDVFVNEDIMNHTNWLGLVNTLFQKIPCNVYSVYSCSALLVVSFFTLRVQSISLSLMIGFRVKFCLDALAYPAIL